MTAGTVAGTGATSFLDMCSTMFVLIVVTRAAALRVHYR